jgi:hypothetical protein
MVNTIKIHTPEKNKLNTTNSSSSDPFPFSHPPAHTNKQKMQPLVFGSNNRKAKSQATSNNNVNTKAKQPAETPVTPCWTVGDILFMRKKGDIDTMLDLLYDAGKLTEELTTFAANHYIDMEAGDREGKIRSRWPNGKREAELPAPVTGEIRSVDIKRDEKGVVQVDVEVVCEV